LKEKLKRANKTNTQTPEPVGLIYNMDFKEGKGDKYDIRRWLTAFLEGQEKDVEFSKAGIATLRACCTS